MHQEEEDVDFFDEFYSQVKHLLTDKDEETCYKEMFRILDDQRKGFICNEEMKELLNKIKQQVQMTDQEVDEVIDYIDKNKDGKVDFSEFYKFMVKDD
ncbi:calmodulin, striated muscle-like isoform X2 [Babylonia areolata]|uniref:calmodulin, striated muscle-like isoform X2 n=1 Tax=Babylonia areolata TaxID=304850 RepID=UPI003FD37CF8